MDTFIISCAAWTATRTIRADCLIYRLACVKHQTFHCSRIKRVEIASIEICACNFTICYAAGILYMYNNALTYT